MPAFYSHFSFGIEGYKYIEDRELKRLVKRHRSVFTLGLLGPDLFFYYLPDVLLGSKKPAMVMHEYKTGRFMEELLKACERLQGEEQQIAYAYIAGFIGHYAMDTVCHPYIYEMASRHENPSSWHYRYESTMDVFCCQHFLHRFPSQINEHRLLSLNKQEMCVVCRLAADAYNKTYRLPHLVPATIKGSIGCMHITIALLKDKRGRKESFVRRLEMRLLGYGLISPLFVNFNMYSVDQREIAHFQRMFHIGVARFDAYLGRLAQHANAARNKTDSSELQRHRMYLLAELGNLSYHTGKPCKPDYHLYFKK